MRTATIAAFVLILAGCGADRSAPAPAAPPPAATGQLAGEVFVVTKGGDNIKLGLVTVTAIPEQAIQAHVSAWQDAVTRRAGELDAAVKSTEEQIKAAKASAGAAQAQAEKIYYECLTSSATRPECARRRDQAAASWQKEAQEHEAERRRLIIEAGSLSSSESLFKELPPGVATAKTNADGKFTMTLPREGRFALSAGASRQILGTVESYHWLVWYSLNGADSGSVMLANDNLTTSGSEESVVSLSQ